MSAHYPTRPDYTDADRAADVLPPVTVDGDANQVTIGDITLPGRWIEQRGVLIQPGGPDDINRVTVTFLVGHVNVTDSALPQVSVRP